jgi:hypothetical protein
VSPGIRPIIGARSSLLSPTRATVARGFEMLHEHRAIRYRRLALGQQDKTIADLLLKLADECDRGFSARPNGDWRRHPAKMSPPQAGDAKFQFEWER